MLLAEIEKAFEKRVREIVRDEFQKAHDKENQTELISIPKISKELQKKPVEIGSEDIEEVEEECPPKTFTDHREVVDSHAAAKIRAFIRKNPGSTKAQIASFLKISHTALSPSQTSPYARGFKILLEDDLIRVEKNGKRLTYFVSE